VALYFLEEVLDPELANRISLDCENDAFVARSTDAEPLRCLAAHMGPLAHDHDALASVLTRAPLDSWTEQFLR
jgi:hypothetical protein